MWGSNVISYGRGFKTVFLTDKIDKLNYKITPILYILISVVLLSNNYLFDDFECLSTIDPDEDVYINSYCYTKGTIALLPNEKLPEKKIDWSGYKNEFTITYIQFLSIMIGLQGLFFLIPELIWKSVCRGKEAYELSILADTACSAKPITKVDRDKILNDICKKFEVKLFIHQEIRQGYATTLRRFLSKYVSIFSFSKRHGTWLVSWYIFTKIIYIVNCFVQLTAFRKSFSYTKDNWLLFPQLLVDILLNGKTWEETRMFPKNTICLIEDRPNLMGMYTSIYNCVIPANVLNEKLIPIIWFYVGFVTLLNIWSLIHWIGQLMIKRLRQKTIIDIIQESGEEFDKRSVYMFVNEYLKCDGLFLVKMIDARCCRSFSVDLVNCIYHRFLGDKVNQSS